MRRAALAVVLASACLEPGASLYERADTTAPEVLFDQMKPRIIDPDAGTPFVQAGQTIEVAFSENMDPLSLRPGIVIRRNPERNEIPLLIQAPPQGTSPYTVRIASGEMTFQSGLYTLQLRTLLIDVAGNPIAEEYIGFFRVP